MKAASAELALTIVAIIAIGLILAFVTGFLGGDGIKDKVDSVWDEQISN